MELKGIDVSHHQGVINWDEVKAAGIQYAIIRCGYGNDLTKQDDGQYLRNVSECERLGIPYGVYLYSYAMSVEEAQSEADHVLRLIKGRHLTYPVFYDLEDAKYTGKCSHKLIGDMAETFCNAIERAGYKVGIYANKNWFTNILTDERFKKWMKWVAQYNTKCTYAGDYVMWQYSSKGSVHGISTAVDMNYCYKDFTSSAPVNVDPLASKSDEELADMVIRGELGAGDNRKKALGSRYDAVQKLVNAKLSPKKPALKSVDEVAHEVIKGLWGSGEERRVKLASAGYDVGQVQSRVNELMGGKSAPKPASKAVYHKVVRGDTLSGIAKKYGTTYQHLAQLNGISNPNRINIGQMIRIK